MNKIKELFKKSPIAMVVAGLVIAGVASAAILVYYGSTTGSATNVQQSVVFGDGTTEQTYEVGNSDPVAGNVYYDLVVLKNNSSNKAALVSLSTQYWYGGHHGFTSDPEPGITTSYLHWATPEKVLTGTRPTAVYNPYDGTGYKSYKKYEVWYKTSASKLRYAYYHPDSSWHYTWKKNKTTNVDAGYDAPFVMKENGKYYMVNYGSGGEKQFDIYTSSNGRHWTDKGTIYSYGGSWNKIDNPKIIKDGDVYRMYFQMKETSDSNTSKYYIFEATSSAKSLKEIAYDAKNGTQDFSIVRGSQYGGSILAPGAEGEWDSFRVMQPMVFKSGNKGYTMLYTGYDKYDMHGKIGYAASDDGVTWTKVKVSKEGYDTNLGTDAWKTSVVKTNDNLVLFYLDESGTHDVINWTWLTNVLNSSNQMTLRPQEIKPFFIKNDFVINLAPGDYKIKTSINPAQ